MRIQLIILLLIISPLSMARQYIQCSVSDSWDRAVINLNHQQPTLYMTNGVHLPDGCQISTLKDLFWINNSENHAHYETKEGQVIELIAIPLNVLGRALSFFEVDFTHLRIDASYQYSRKMQCFSSIHAD